MKLLRYDPKKMYIKLTLLFLFLIFIGLRTNAQIADFSAYERVTNQSFIDFLAKFPQKDLGVDGQQLRNSELSSLSVKNLTESDLNNFLSDNEGLVFPPLIYISSEIEFNIPSTGIFQPICSFPTNGDYVLLAVLQYASDHELGFKGWLITLDLNGDIINLIDQGFLFSGVDNLAQSQLDDSLILTNAKVLDLPENRMDYFKCNPCKKEYRQTKIQIGSDGVPIVLLSQTKHERLMIYNGFNFEFIETH